MKNKRLTLLFVVVLCLPIVTLEIMLLTGCWHQNDEEYRQECGEDSDKIKRSKGRTTSTGLAWGSAQAQCQPRGRRAGYGYQQRPRALLTELHVEIGDLTSAHQPEQVEQRRQYGQQDMDNGPRPCRRRPYGVGAQEAHSNSQKRWAAQL